MVFLCPYKQVFCGLKVNLDFRRFLPFSLGYNMVKRAVVVRSLLKWFQISVGRSVECRDGVLSSQVLGWDHPMFQLALPRTSSANVLGLGRIAMLPIQQIN